MDKFTKACRLACEQWVDSLPQDVPTHHFSPAFEEAVRPLLQPNITAVPKKKRKFTKKTLKILVAAAVLLALAVATTAIAVPLARRANVTQLPDHGEYEVADPENAPEVNDLTVGYVPQGFEKTEDYGYLYIYENGNQSFAIEKYKLGTKITYDTEDYPSESITINGAPGIYYRSDSGYSGIIFNNGEYIFAVDGNISKEELVKIAQNVR